MTKNYRTNFIEYLKLILSCIFILSFVYDFATVVTVPHTENFVYYPYLAESAKNIFSEFAKLFDVCSVDFCIARFRPFGHFLELIDAKVIKNFPWVGFKSISHFISALLSAFTVYLCLQNMNTKLTKASKVLISTFTLALPTFPLMSAVYFRPGKSFAAFAALYVFYLWLKYSKIPLKQVLDKKEKLTWAFHLALLSIFTIGDEQVVLVIGIMMMVSLFEFIILKKGHLYQALTWLSLIFFLVGTYVIGPLTYSQYSQKLVTGYENYNNPLSFVSFNVDGIYYSFKALFWEYGLFFGNSGDYNFILLKVLAIIYLGFLLDHFISKKKRTDSKAVRKRFTDIFKNIHPYYVLIAISLGIVGSIYALGLRHPPVFQDGTNQSGYYIMPTSMLLWIAFIWFMVDRKYIDKVINSYIISLVMIFFLYLNTKSVYSFRSYTSLTDYTLAPKEKPLTGWAECRFVRDMTLNPDKMKDKNDYQISEKATAFIEYYLKNK